MQDTGSLLHFAGIVLYSTEGENERDRQTDTQRENERKRRDMGRILLVRNLL